MTYNDIRLDHRIILEMIEQRSNVLDLGCGTGDLLQILIKEKNVRGQGIDIDDQAIYACVEKGLNVLHGDIDSGLCEYRDKAFDYVVLHQSLQQVKHLDLVFRDTLRVGKKVIVGVPNFAYYKARFQLAVLGKAPVTGSLPYSWHETPNVHFLSLSDFIGYCRETGVSIERAAFLDEARRIRIVPNIFAQTGIFLISK